MGSKFQFTDAASIAAQPFFQVKYPDIHVQLSGQNGNVYNLILLVAQALEKAGIGKDEVALFRMEAMSKENYDAVLTFLMQTVDVS